MAPGLITDRKLFGQEHKPAKRFPDKNLNWQYFNFYAYRTFMDLIPARWRDVPVFITETDQVQMEWANTNSGWVKEMYAEVDRWHPIPVRSHPYDREPCDLCVLECPIGDSAIAMAIQTGQIAPADGMLVADIAFGI